MEAATDITVEIQTFIRYAHKLSYYALSGRNQFWKVLLICAIGTVVDTIIKLRNGETGSIQAHQFGADFRCRCEERCLLHCPFCYSVLRRVLGNGSCHFFAREGSLGFWGVWGRGCWRGESWENLEVEVNFFLMSFRAASFWIWALWSECF